jgi:hypothetical protein
VVSNVQEKEKNMAFPMGLRVLGLGVLFLLPSLGRAADQQLNTDAIEKAIGKSGQVQDEVYKISLPRTDLAISVEGVQLRPTFALGSWIAFKPMMGKAVAHGDLVLTEEEVGSVVRQLDQDGIKLTALHNHLIRESPKVMYLHFWAEGEAEQVAISLRRALALTKTPFEKANVAQIGQSGGEEHLPSERIQELVGHKGTVKDGVLSIVVPRPETVIMSKVELPPSMGMATAMNFQVGAAGKVAATGDFVLAAHEVSGVASALVRHGLQVTALHNHLVHGSPELYFMHFWAHDSVDSVANGLRAGIDAMKRNP